MLVIELGLLWSLDAESTRTKSDVTVCELVYGHRLYSLRIHLPNYYMWSMQTETEIPKTSETILHVPLKTQLLDEIQNTELREPFLSSYEIHGRAAPGMTVPQTDWAALFSTQNLSCS